MKNPCNGLSLRNCPFCQSHRVRSSSHGTNDERGMVFYVECEDCGAEGPKTGSPCCARVAWNARGEAGLKNIRPSCKHNWGPAKSFERADIAALLKDEVPW